MTRIGGYHEWFWTVIRCICLKYQCPSVFSDSYEAYLSEKSVPPRDFGQLQTVVMFSGPGYDFRQGSPEVRHPVAQIAWDRQP